MTIATEAEAIREWAHNVGYEDCYKDRQWICSNYDTWERNPYYSGPEQEHPEAACDDYWYETELYVIEWTEVEVFQLKDPVDFKSRNAACSLIVHFRDGKPVYEGDPVLDEIPF